MQSARPHPPRPTLAYVKELTALDASRQREILREWLARSETVSPLSPSSLAEDYEEFVITAVRDLPKAPPSPLSPQAAEAARKLPAWSFALGALPLAILVLLLAHVDKGGAPPAPHPQPTVAVSTVQAMPPVLEMPPTQPAAVAVQPTPTVVPAKKSPSIRPVETAASVAPPVVQPVAAPVPGVNTELVANSEFGDRK